MGPNALWLTESLAGCMNLEPNMRVLDMGCGKRLSSIFLAKEYGVEVWATDLWIDASDNFRRFCAAGVEDRVFPIHAEAHALPYADGFFDAMVSVDAYHYFGTDDLYLETHMAKLIKPGGQMGIVVPGLVRELTSNEPPEHLRNYWEPALFSLHSPTWWNRHWERSGHVTVELADLIPDGWRLWMVSDQVWSEWLGKPSEEADMLALDGGRALGSRAWLGAGMSGQRRDWMRCSREGARVGGRGMPRTENAWAYPPTHTSTRLRVSGPTARGWIHAIGVSSTP